MCCGGSSSSLSRLGISVGLLSLVTLVTAFVTNVWLYTREPITLPNSQIITTITFRIGYWRVCPTLKKPNASYTVPSPSCSLIRYSSWNEIKEADVGVFWSPLDFTPNFISRMRYSMPFEAIAVVIMLIATVFALIGHCNSDNKTLIACGLYTLGGLSLAGGLLIFASVLSDVFTDRSTRSFTTTANDNDAIQLNYDYQYGWSFMAAGTAFIIAEIAALITITAYLRRFTSVEEMVRVMVPGAERKLRQHYQHDRLIKRSSCNLRRDSIQKTETLISNELDGCEGPLLRTKTPPDICTTNNKNILGELAAEYPNLAGTTVPITLMHQKPNIQNSNHLSTGQPTTLLLPSQDYRYATIASCTLVHQGMLGVSEGLPGTSSSSESSDMSGMMLSNRSSDSRRRSQHAPRLRKANNNGFMTLDTRVQQKLNFSPSSFSQGYYSGNAV